MRPAPLPRLHDLLDEVPNTRETGKFSSPPLSSQPFRILLLDVNFLGLSLLIPVPGETPCSCSRSVGYSRASSLKADVWFSFSPVSLAVWPQPQTCLALGFTVPSPWVGFVHLFLAPGQARWRTHKERSFSEQLAAARC